MRCAGSSDGKFRLQEIAKFVGEEAGSVKAARQPSLQRGERAVDIGRRVGADDFNRMLEKLRYGFEARTVVEQDETFCKSRCFVSGRLAGGRIGGGGGRAGCSRIHACFYLGTTTISTGLDRPVSAVEKPRPCRLERAS